jgi:hypothetical protein
MNIPDIIGVYRLKILGFLDADPGSSQPWIRDGKNRIQVADYPYAITGSGSPLPNPQTKNPATLQR